MAKRTTATITNPFVILGRIFRGEVTPNRNDDLAAAGRGRPAILRRNVRGWRVAKSLDRLLAQINELAPNRNKASDGSIGDASHQTRDSDHNPWVTDGNLGVVTARDFTHDPANGCDCQKIADAIVAARDPRVKYLIWNRKICNSKVSPWKWRRYTGSNPHTKHIHISVLPQKSKYDDESNWDLTGMAVAMMAETFEVEDAADIELAWGKKVTGAFKSKVVTIAAKLDTDPNYLMAAMAFESARTFSPKIQNKASKATGLIQFLPSTARRLGTSVAALKKMTAVKQLDYVDAYLEPYRGRLKDLSDVYMAILWPKAVGKPASYALFSTPSRAYRLNAPLDANSDGAVTKAEAAARVQNHLVEGLRDEWLG